ncbi:phage tail family protein [Curtobacterium sp. MCBA15_004]|uniref:phage distal tail protein n=1 Tax=Curtobacterium sp. MCBA15_004 TaxID=1898733 RepID=UPI0008DC755D|nr:phage tail family protein [Curtobacterium sp. MCBA15_004]WIA96407.1 phage tail family protein [Curtobacterium sp. MCBA15_004]
MPILPDQVTASLNGIVFGGIDQYGVDWSLQALDGWSATSSTTRATQRARRSGSLLGTPFATGRSVSLSGRIFAPTADLLSDAIDRLNAAVTLSDSQLFVTEASRTRYAWLRQSDDVITKHLMPTIATYSIQLIGADWRKFGADVSNRTRLPSTTGGLIINSAGPATADYASPDQAQAAAMSAGLRISPTSDPAYYDLQNADGTPATATYLAVPTTATGLVISPAGLTIDAVTVTGQVSLTNPGNDTGPLRLRIDGPCTGPVVTHVGTGDRLVFSSSLVLAAGEWLDIDMEKRQVYANGQSSRAGYITSRGWFGFDPGPNTFAFTAAQYNAASQLTVAGTPAWR